MFPKSLTIALSSIAIFACSWVYFSQSLLPPKAQSNVSLSTTTSSFHAPKHNVWADLDEAEFDDLLKFLYARSTGLNVSKGSETTSGNQLLLVETLLPNKTDVLQYIDGASQPPPRWARVTVSQADFNDAWLVDYMVGPLPTSNATKALPLDYCYNSGRNFVRNPVPSIDALKKWLDRELAKISDITQELLGSKPNSLNHTDPNGLEVASVLADLTDSGTTTWLQFCRLGSWSGARSLLGQGLAAKIQLASDAGDPGDLQILEWYYNDVLYNSSDALRAALQDPTFVRLKPNLDGDWTDTEDYSSGLPEREMPPPVMVQPAGPRYQIDQKEHYVSWMDFDFYYSTNQITGVSLFDIRFKGERIIYELSMMEALSHYAGSDPVQSGLYFLDTFFGMGMRSFELVPGYDCPIYATYLSTSYHVGEKTVTNKNNICLFEYTADHALQRHTKANTVTISRNQYLVLRTVSTVGNYDYTIEYLFYLDGSIEVKYRASGFIFGAFYNSPINEDTQKTHPTEHGYRVHDAVATSMHDHVLNFKADFDIDGTSNTLMRVGIEPTLSNYPWEDPAKPPRNTMHLMNTPVTTETGLNWPRNSGEIYLLMNNESVNAWGEKRGYRITPGTGMGTPIHLTIQNSSSLSRGGSWAYQDLWVLRQKDTEPKSGSPMNFISANDPLVDFSKMVNDEETVQKDLVVYFNLGGHHIAHSGDIPNTLMHTSASSVMFLPHNFHSRDPSRETVQGVKLEFGDAGKQNATYFGGRYREGVNLDIDDLEADLSRYQSSKHDVTDLSFNKSILGGM